MYCASSLLFAVSFLVFRADCADNQCDSKIPKQVENIDKLDIAGEWHLASVTRDTTDELINCDTPVFKKLPGIQDVYDVIQRVLTTSRSKLTTVSAKMTPNGDKKNSFSLEWQGMNGVLPSVLTVVSFEPGKHLCAVQCDTDGTSDISKLLVYVTDPATDVDSIVKSAKEKLASQGLSFSEHYKPQKIGSC